MLKYDDQTQPWVLGCGQALMLPMFGCMHRIFCYVFIMASFFAIDNFTTIHTTLQGFFKKKYNLDLNQLQSGGVVDIKKMIYLAMKNTNNAMPTSTIHEKNKEVLRESKDKLITVYNRIRDVADAKRIDEQQRIMSSKRALPDAPTSYNGDVMKEYTSLQQSREAEWKNAPQSEPGFKTIEEPAFSNDDFLSNYEKLKEQRADAYVNMQPQNELMPPNTQSTMILKQTDQPQHYPMSMDNLPKKRVVRMLLNSSDRDVVTYPYNNKFRVRFGRPVWQTYTTLVTNNCITIPGTKTLHYEGIPNTSGCIFMGSSLLPYNPLIATPQPLLPGDVIGESKAHIPCDGNASCNEEMEEVASVCLEEISMTRRNGSYVPAVLSVNVDEIEGDVDSTNDANYRAIGTLSLKKVVRDATSGIDTLLYHAPYRQEKTLLPAQTLRHATFTINDVAGLQLNDGSRDGAVVVGIAVDSTSNIQVLISGNATFYDIRAGDVIRISEVVLYPVLLTDSVNLADAATNFVNRAQGHSVIAVSGNQITIAPPGEYTPMGFVMDAQTTEFIGRFQSQNPISTGKYINGYVLNLSKQMTINMVVTLHMRAWNHPTL